LFASHVKDYTLKNIITNMTEYMFYFLNLRRIKKISPIWNGYVLPLASTEIGDKDLWKNLCHEDEIFEFL